jgi:hypothetical protein
VRRHGLPGLAPDNGGDSRLPAGAPQRDGVPVRGGSGADHRHGQSPADMYLLEVGWEGSICLVAVGVLLIVWNLGRAAVLGVRRWHRGPR